MPFLPSGLVVGISSEAILEDIGPNWLKCPKGHFWYVMPDLTISPPPYRPDSTFLQDFRHAPVPRNHEELKRYLRVMFRDEQERWWWRGDWLNKYPQPGELDCDDLRVWNEYLASEKARAFFDQALQECKTQARLNRRNRGFGLASSE